MMEISGDDAGVDIKSSDTQVSNGTLNEASVDLSQLSPNLHTPARSTAPSSPSEVPSHWIDAVKLVIGSSKIEFTAHRNVISQYSSFFLRALQSEFVEAHENVIRLPEDEPRVVHKYLEWVYNGGIEPGDIQANEYPIHGWIDLYIFAEKVDDSMLKDTILARLYEVRDAIASITVDDCVSVFKKTPHKNKLKAFIKDWWMVNARMEQVDSALVTRVPDLAAWLIRSMIKGRPGASASSWRFKDLAAYMERPFTPET